MIRCRVLATMPLLIACGDSLQAPSQDAASADSDYVAGDAARDAFVPLVRVFGYVEAYGDPVYAATVTTLEGSQQSTTTALNGTFYFDVPQGSRLIMKVDPTGITGALPMIRGVIAYDHLRPRNFYLITAEEVAGASSLGITLDPADAIVEVDFRNAAIGGYGATLTTTNNAPLVPDFGIVYDDQGQPQLGQITVAGGSGSTLLLGGLPPGPATFAATVPAEATLPCQPRDANPLPLEAGVVSWFDYECGNGED